MVADGASPFGDSDATLSSKLDVSPPVWLDPVQRGWVAMPVHATYGTPPLPALQVIRMEENLAEKISRLNRTTTARDMYDLAWVAQNQHNLGGGTPQVAVAEGSVKDVSFSTVCALTPERNMVYRYDEVGTSWTRIGVSANAGDYHELFGGGYGLAYRGVAQGGLPAGTIWLYRPENCIGATHAWHSVGNPGATFVVTADTIYGLTPDKGAVYRYNGCPAGFDGSSNAWTRVGGSAGWIYGGTWGVVATNPADGNLFRYLGSPDKWEYIGAPGATFAVTAESVYGLTPDQNRVYRYDGHGDSWTQVGGWARQLYGGDWGLVATAPNGSLYRYLGSPDQWQLIGGAGAMFAVTAKTVFGLSPSKDGVYRYDGHGTSWTKVGGPAHSIVACSHV